MSLMDKIKAFFSGGPAKPGEDHAHDHADDQGHTHGADREHGSSYLQTPTDPEAIVEPTPEEVAAATRAEPPTTTVEGLSEDEPRSDPSSEHRDEVH